LNDGKYFKKLNKIITKGEAAKGDAYHVDESGARPSHQFGFRFAQRVSGVRVITALNQRNLSPVGQLIPTRRIGISL